SSAMESWTFLAALTLLSWLILISLLICSGVSENSATARTLVCSQTLGESGEELGTDLRTLKKVQTPLLSTPRSATNCRCEPSGSRHSTYGSTISPVSTL